MELTGETVIRAERADVWRALNDPEVLARCIPGCEEVRRVSPEETHVRLRLKLGPVRARFVGKLVMSDVRPDRGCVMNFEGSGGVAGFAKGSSTVELDTDAADAASTRLRYTAQAAIGGKLGQIGGRMIDASAKQMADQFFRAFGDQLAAPPVELPAQPSTMPAAAHVPAPMAVAPATPQATQAPHPSARPAMPDTLAGEGVRVLWFGLGAGATALGFCIAAVLIR